MCRGGGLLLLGHFQEGFISEFTAISPLTTRLVSGFSGSCCEP